ncbi:MAG: hypothetical protein GY851_23605 [bacterium]|nr:hypothetical protein [bacterium]
MNRDYDYYREALKGYALPCALVDLDVLDDHADSVAAMADGKSIRVDSRFLRCAPLLERLMSRRPEFGGVVVSSAAEAVFLSLRGFDDLLIARPVWGEADTSGIMDVLHLGKKVVCAVDCLAHSEHLNTVGQDFNTVVSVAMEVDVCPRYAAFLTSGLRSGVSMPRQAAELAATIAEAPFLRLAGIVGHVPVTAAGDSWLKRVPLRGLICAALMRRARATATARRKSFVEAVAAGTRELDFVTGCAPCSGTLAEADDTVTEWAAGSELVDPAISAPCEGPGMSPAAGLAVEVVRTRSGGRVECRGTCGFPQTRNGIRPLPAGSRVASAGPNGPLVVRHAPGANTVLEHGSPVILLTNDTPSLFESTNTILLVSDGRVVDEVPTYRGEGQCLPL